MDFIKRRKAPRVDANTSSVFVFDLYDKWKGKE